MTGKNGSGKTSLLLEIEKFLRAINDEKLSQVFDQYPTWINEAKKEKYYLHLVIAKNMRQIRILNNV